MQAAGQSSRRISRGSEENARRSEPDRDHRGPGPTQGRATLPSAQPTEAACNSLDEQSITDELVQAALVSALQSREFQSAPQLRAFLGFVVRATLDREQEKVKGYTIAVEALGRPEDFNPVTDPIVRVEAARLRRRLEKYYAGSGADDPVRILIPKGSYAPEFSSVAQLEKTGKPGAGVLAFQETGKAYDPDAGHHMEDAPSVSETLPLETLEADANAASTSGLAGRLPSPTRDAENVSIDTKGSRQPAWLNRHSVPLALTLLFGGTCFMAGYLLALILRS